MECFALQGWRGPGGPRGGPPRGGPRGGGMRGGYKRPNDGGAGGVNKRPRDWSQPIAQQPPGQEFYQDSW